MERAIEAADAVRSGHGDEYWISKQFIFVYDLFHSLFIYYNYFFLNLKGGRKEGFGVWVNCFLNLGSLLGLGTNFL